MFKPKNQYKKDRKYEPVGLGVSFIGTLWTFCGVKLYFFSHSSRGPRERWSPDTALLMARVYSRAPKLVWGTMSPTLSWSLGTLFWSGVNERWAHAYVKNPNKNNMARCDIPMKSMFFELSRKHINENSKWPCASYRDVFGTLDGVVACRTCCHEMQIHELLQYARGRIQPPPSWLICGTETVVWGYDRCKRDDDRRLEEAQASFPRQRVAVASICPLTRPTDHLYNQNAFFVLNFWHASLHQ